MRRAEELREKGAGSAGAQNEDAHRWDTLPRPGAGPREDLTLSFVRDMNGRVLPVNEGFTANKFGVIVEACDFHPVIAEVSVIQFIPVEIREEEQFCLPRFDAVRWVVPVAFLPF